MHAFAVSMQHLLQNTSDMHQSQRKFSGSCGACRASRMLSRSNFSSGLVHVRSVLHLHARLPEKWSEAQVTCTAYPCSHIEICIGKRSTWFLSP